jgi:histidinol phosphatase-like enzyme
MNKRIALDFDGTIVEENYPNIGELRAEAKYYINKLYDDGFTIIINTCRSGVFAENAKNFLIKNKIRFHYFNENDPVLIKQYSSDCRKISADVYIDDRCLTGLPEWEEIYKILIDKFYE